MQVKIFEFNPFQQNTFLLYGNNECALVDAGCYDADEQQAIVRFVAEHALTMRHILITHGHLDHIFGNAWACNYFKLPLTGHAGDQMLVESVQAIAARYGLQAEPSPAVTQFLVDGDTISLAGGALQILHVPGHSPGSVAYYSKADGFVLAGDVLFAGSVGRTDLPGGSMDVLMHSIRTQLLGLPDNTTVYPGHGPATTIGRERATNPFLRN